MRNKWRIKNFRNLTFTKCGKFILGVSDSIWIKQVSIISETVELFCDPKWHEIWVYFFLSPSHKYFCLIGKNFSILNSDTKELKFVSKWNPFKNLQAISWSPYEDKVAFANWDGIWLLDVEKQMISAQIRASFWKTWAPCWPICFTKCGRYIIVGWNDGWIRLWVLESQKNQRKIELTENYTTSAAFSSCESYLYRVNNCGSVDRYDIIKKHSENWIKGSGNYYDSVATFSRCRKYVAVQQNSWSLAVWNLDTKEIFCDFETNLISRYDLLSFSGSGKLLFSNNWKSMAIWNLEQNSLVSILECNTNMLAISLNDKYFALSQTYNRSIEIWEFEQDYKKIQNWNSDRPIKSLLFSACCEFLYSGDYVGNVEIWDFRKAEKIRAFGRCNQSVIFMAICPRGLISRTSRKVFLWNPPW
ncbi:unnamed protein product [Blepharisma stoltei]|uniref:Uncharacterized protein n=1 Tax=Blepharisma stoltei TaxID=1481888 RepID=A0AAU9JBC9_9CILI|nr:unnamed protein product [Blepharisma stoltei]